MEQAQRRKSHWSVKTLKRSPGNLLWSLLVFYNQTMVVLEMTTIMRLNGQRSRLLQRIVVQLEIACELLTSHEVYNNLVSMFRELWLSYWQYFIMNLLDQMWSLCTYTLPWLHCSKTHIHIIISLGCWENKMHCILYLDSARTFAL